MDLRWIIVTLIVFALCAIVPIRIYALPDHKRRFVNWFILIPVSLVILFYVYPAGIEFFRTLATE